MNYTKLEELAEKSGLATAADVRSGYIYPRGMEKFAELIIEECCQHLTNRGYDAARELIERHFDIK
jgi:hypothetical protein